MQENLSEITFESDLGIEINCTLNFNEHMAEKNKYTNRMVRVNRKTFVTLDD